MGFWNKARALMLQGQEAQHTTPIRTTRSPAPSKIAPSQQLLNLYKSRDYAVLPEPVPDGDAAHILASYENFPAQLTPKSYMHPVRKNLLRGDIVLLWWLGSRNNIGDKPRYFLFRYGIDTTKSEQKLRDMKLLGEDEKPTESGKALIDASHQLIRQHKAEYTVSPNGRITYHYADTELASSLPSQQSNGTLRFKSTGDFIKDDRLGDSYLKRGDLENAMSAYQSAESLAANDPDFQDAPVPAPIWGQAQVLHRQQQYVSEKKLIKVLLKFYPDKYEFKQRKKLLDSL